MGQLKNISLLAFSLAVMRTSTLYAADLDPAYGTISPLQQERIEFGSGWYVRGDLGATRSPSVSPNTGGLLTNEQAYDYYSGTPYRDPEIYNDNASQSNPSISNGSTLGYNASLGGGYQFNKWFRTDVLFDFHKPVVGSASSSDIFCETGVTYLNSKGVQDLSLNGLPSTGNCRGTYKASLKSYDVMLNGYLDLGTWYSVTPYVGAGVGLSFGHYQTSSTYVQGNNVPYQITYTDPKFGSNSPNFDKSSSGTYYNFAYALMAGFSIDVADHTKFDIGYRYLNLGKIPGITSGDLYTNEVRAGVRYMIDN